MRTKPARLVIGALAMALVIVLLAETPSAFADVATDSVHIGGAGIPGIDWSIDQLQKQFAGEIASVQYTSHGQKHVYQCVSLVSLLKAAGVSVDLKMAPKADPKLKSYSLRFAVVARGRDGYVVAFSLAELLPEVGNRHVWLALDEDGQPISDQDGPIRLLTPDDQKPARGVHELADITIIDTAAATTRPDATP
jgi:hypothetical protein